MVGVVELAHEPLNVVRPYASRIPLRNEAESHLSYKPSSNSRVLPDTEVLASTLEQQSYWAQKHIGQQVTHLCSAKEKFFEYLQIDHDASPLRGHEGSPTSNSGYTEVGDVTRDASSGFAEGPVHNRSSGGPSRAF